MTESHNERKAERLPLVILCRDVINARQLLFAYFWNIKINLTESRFAVGHGQRQIHG